MKDQKISVAIYGAGGHHKMDILQNEGYGVVKYRSDALQIPSCPTIELPMSNSRRALDPNAAKSWIMKQK